MNRSNNQGRFTRKIFPALIKGIIYFLNTAYFALRRVNLEFLEESFRNEKKFRK